MQTIEQVLERIKDKQELSKEDLEVVRELYIGYAEDIRDSVSKNWFDTYKLVKKLKIPLDDAQNLLQQLMYFGLCVCKKDKGIDVYKIDISQEDLKKILEDEHKKLSIQLKYITQRLEKLNKQ